MASRATLVLSTLLVAGLQPSVAIAAPHEEVADEVEAPQEASPSASDIGPTAPAPEPAEGEQPAPVDQPTAVPEADAAVQPSPQETAPEGQTRFDSLPPNPAFTPLKRRALAEPAPARKRHEKRLELSGKLGAAYRRLSGSEVTLGPGYSLGGHARLGFTSWLGLGFEALIENHSVDIASEAFGFEGLSSSHADLRVVHLGAQLEPRLVLSEHFFLGFGLGAAWNRLEAGGLRVSEPVPFELGSRTGVLVEITASPRASVRFSRRFGASFWGSMAIPAIQSGNVFAHGEGDLQTVRSDTGQLLGVGGFPDFSLALSSHLSFDVLF